MDSRRYEGELKKWNAERGFGFIMAADGGQDVFVHISAFARDGRLPVEGESLIFEVEPDRNGKRSAVRVRRPGDSQSVRVGAAPLRMKRSNTASRGAGWIQKIIVGLLLVAMSAYAYDRYTSRTKQLEAQNSLAVQPPAPVSLFEDTQSVPATFSCDGRSHCSQMTSCQEAKLFLKNCPGMKMDGDGDGVPCEEQWCTGLWVD